MNKEQTLVYIAKQDFYDVSIDDIAFKLDMKVDTIRQYKATPEYRSKLNMVKDAHDVQKKKESSVRTRELVERLLEELEKKVEITDDPLQFIDEIKQLYTITGVSADTLAVMNVVKIADQLDVGEFNSQGMSKGNGDEGKRELNKMIVNVKEIVNPSEAERENRKDTLPLKPQGNVRKKPVEKHSPSLKSTNPPSIGAIESDIIESNTEKDLWDE